MNNPIKNDEIAEKTDITDTPSEVVVEEITPAEEVVSENLPPIPPAKKDAGQQIKDMSKKVPLGPGNFWNNMLTTVLLLIVVTAVFSYITESNVKPSEISITDVVGQVKAGEVKTIIVRGDVLEVTYNDETRTVGEAKREVDASISETLTNLGVTDEQLSKIKIDVQRETGFAYWFSNFAPFLFPLLFL